jgi:AraC-like DNA-binding protein
MSVDLVFSGTMHIVKLLTGKKLYPIRMSSRYPRPRDTREYMRVLKIEPSFNQPCNCVVLRLRDVQLPIIGHNPTLNALFRELLEKEIAKTREQESFANEVRRAVLQNFNTTLPQLTDVVEVFRITPRTLQRKLKDEGTSFQEIAESVKSELAIGLLKNRSLTVNEVAYKLGYAEPSVFRRAFKKWTGVSPKVYVTR